MTFHDLFEVGWQCPGQLDAGGAGTDDEIVQVWLVFVGQLLV
jgi:hypothetical protein